MKKDMKITAAKCVFAIIALITVSCGGTMDKQIRENVYLNSQKVESEAIYAEELINIALDKFEKIYGGCDKDVLIEMEEPSFFSDELDKVVSGLSYNYGNSCTIIVGYQPSDSCETIQITMHELYHCCKDVSSHGAWVIELFELREEMREKGDC
jgi:hypothetical protein